VRGLDLDTEIDAAEQRHPMAATDGDSRECRIESFPVGYHRLHPDVSLNYQMNRFNGKANTQANMIAEMRGVAPKIHDYSDYIREFLALSERALARGDTLDGAASLRSAEFFMFSDDPRKQPSRRQFIRLMREYFHAKTSERFDIPFQGGALSAYRFVAPRPKGTIVVHGGFDSYIEEMFPIQFCLSGAGYDIVAFEGPGQGTPLEDSHLPMTPEWEKPVKAILDYFHLDDVTLMGVSLGGCLALRAAAHEPRVQRVVADDVLTDFYEACLRQTSATQRRELAFLLKAGAAGVVNALSGKAMKKSLAVEWGVRQGMYTTGTKSPYEFLKQTQLYRTDDVSPFVKQDVLLMAGAEDHYVPPHQFYDQILSLNHVRSLTARLFTREEQAQNHCQTGNVGLALRVITDWIEGSHLPSLGSSRPMSRVG